MAISLQKGQRVDLTKGNSNLNRIMVGLGWDPVSQSKGGFFSAFKATEDIDCDASVLMLKDDRFESQNDLVYFGNLGSKCRSVVHSGDNLTGEGDGDDETLIVELKSVPANFNKLVFVVNIYDCEKRKQHFGMLKNAYIRVVDPMTHQELIRYNLSDNYSGRTAVIAGEIYRHNGEWKFGAVGDGTNDRNLTEITRRYQ